MTKTTTKLTKVQTKSEQINEAVTNYQRTLDEQYFESAFALCKNVLDGMSKKFANSRPDISLEDFISEGNFRFSKLVQAYDEEKGDFVNILSRTLRNSFVQLTRNSELKLETTPQYRELDGEVVDILDSAIIEGVTTDDSIAADNGMMVSKRSSLIASLLNGISHDMRETVRVFLTTTSFVEAGKVLGVSDTTVKRRLESLARKFDASTFGDIADYLGTGGNEYVAK